MDRITAKQRDTIKKASSERLRDRLVQTGWSAEEVARLHRDQLMNAVAELYVVPAGAAAPVVLASETLAAKELELTEREIALGKREMQAQQQP